MTAPAAPRFPTSGGKKLTSDAASVANWKTVAWLEENITFQVPADWEQVELTKRAVEFRPPDRKAYFTGNIAYFDQKIPYQSLWDSFLQKGNGKLLRGEILGFALKNLGKGEGYLEISRRSDGTSMASWSGYVDTAQFGTKAVNLLVGAPTPEDFQNFEPIFGAILDSVQIR